MRVSQKITIIKKIEELTQDYKAQGVAHSVATKKATNVVTKLLLQGKI